MSDSRWSVRWYRPNDIAMMQFEGYFSAEALIAAMDELSILLDGAEGDLRIYIISEESLVTSFEPDLHVQAVLHPVYFHPRGGKLYIVGSQGELFAINEALAKLREGAIRLIDTLEEAIADIDKRRAAYSTKKKES